MSRPAFIAIAIDGRRFAWRELVKRRRRRVCSPFVRTARLAPPGV
jgi:hypothetical protein